MRSQHYAYTFFAAAISMAVINSTQAQTNQAQNNQVQTNSYIEEIVVTSTKRGTSLQDLSLIHI